MDVFKLDHPRTLIDEAGGEALILTLFVHYLDNQLRGNERIDIIMAPSAVLHPRSGKTKHFNTYITERHSRYANEPCNQALNILLCTLIRFSV